MFYSNGALTSSVALKKVMGFFFIAPIQAGGFVNCVFFKSFVYF